MKYITLFFGITVCLSACKTPNLQESNINQVGPIGPLMDGKLDLSRFPETALTKKSYLAAVADFHAAYGSSASPYDVVSLRANRFLSRKSWDRTKAESNYNPITATDKYNFENNANKSCREPDLDGNPTNVWMAFERAASYANEVLLAASKGKPIPWSPNYKRLLHVKNWFSTKANSDEKAAFELGKSNGFDLNVILSIHAANGEGATQNSGSCGKIAQIKVCDGHSYSPFFHPDPRPLPCRFGGGWYPSESAWTVMLSDEMRQRGQTVVPLPDRDKRETYLPEEYQNKGWTTCAQAKELENSLQYSESAKANDWPDLKGKKLPQFTMKSMQKGPAFLADSGKLKELSAFAMYASVEQTYKDLANYRLNPKYLDTSRPECRPCGLQKRSPGVFEWNLDKREICPQACLAKELRDLMNQERAPGKGLNSDFLRSYFEPDLSDPNYPAIASLVDKHLAAVAKQTVPPQDPIALSANVQQWFVAMHPFIDGDGRTSRYLMEIVLHSSGLPFPVLEDFWSDSDLSVRDYTNHIRQGIDRHIGVLKACTAYVTCMKKQSPVFVASNIASVKDSDTACKENLKFKYGINKFDTTLQAKDCNTNWDRNPASAKFGKCS